MKYDLSKTLEINKMFAKIDSMINRGVIVELTEKKPVRTLSQNSYLHVCITLFAIEFGYNLKDAKQHLKRKCSFMHEGEGEGVRTKLTRSLDTKQLIEFIEWIRTYASQQGCYIPTPEEYITNRFEIDREIDRNKEFL